ncbi:hypothetical protein L1987_02131 [Smallanthus sonchifolius]|uniref:Uncharacterized protein n=1 Tax=Smallanthus sonchifolius TaxID=185202 RepID=A0ACB9K6Y6_9ASTR|nr:hypothetical protein L1987_02131 [Smallanthus sonchifolius]
MDVESNSEVDLKKTKCEEEAKRGRRRTGPPPQVIAGAREEMAETAVFGDCCDGFTTDADAPNTPEKVMRSAKKNGADGGGVVVRIERD